MSHSESCWSKCVENAELVKLLLDNAATLNNDTAVNSLNALNALVDGGDKGREVVMNAARLQSLLPLCKSGDSRLQEGMLDLLCQIACHSETRIGLAALGIADILTDILIASSSLAQASNAETL